MKISRPHGFNTAMAAIIIAAMLVILGFLGYRFLTYNSQNASQQQTKPTPKGWLTYRSSHSTLQFSYPPSWKLNNNTSNIDSPAWLVEGVDLKGPNHFSMYFSLERRDHVNPAGQCALLWHGESVKINKNYVMVTESNNDNKDAYDVQLIQSDHTTPAGRSCNADFSLIPIDKDIGFNFSGSYLSAKPSATYLSLPEVQTAKAIFGSIKQ